jgi:hypothetical protein
VSTLLVVVGVFAAVLLLVAFLDCSAPPPAEEDNRPRIPAIRPPPMDAPDEQWLDFAALTAYRKWIAWAEPGSRARGIRVHEAYNQKWCPAPQEEP